jgi:predicted nucleic acid-binding protein
MKVENNTRYVLDCSFCAALFIPDENSELVVQSFENIKDHDKIYIPTLWWYEISNVLTLSVKRNRLKHYEVVNIIKLFEDYNLEIDSTFGREYSERIFELSQLYHLTAYDTIYLELSIRKDAILATLDKQLIDAAKKVGITVVV